MRGGRFKAKEIYLLSGLLFCGECGASLSGNTRLCGRRKSKYASYRCSNRAQHKGCINKEIKKEYLESYVLDELYQKLFSGESVQKLAVMLTDYSNNKKVQLQDDVGLERSRLGEINGRINAIVQLVTDSGISIDTVRDNLLELETHKNALEDRLKNLHHAQAGRVVEVEQIQELIEHSREFVLTKNLAECRRFIESYIEKVLVFHEHVEIYFKIHVPNDSGEGTQLLTAEEEILTIRAEYKAG